MLMADLTFEETLAAGTVNVVLTAVLIGGLATYLVKKQEDRAADVRSKADQRHEEELQERLLEHQAREALRKTYSQLLRSQRRSRELSLELSLAGGASANPDLAAKAKEAHSEFIGDYHALNLDVSLEMWKEARDLRDVLSQMLVASQEGDRVGCENLAKDARSARQNLERSFRIRLGYAPLRETRKRLEYSKNRSE